MRKHTYLPAMVGFVRDHVAQHFQPNRPRRSPAISPKLLVSAATAKRFSQHLAATSRALSQSRAGLPRRAVRAVELRWNLQVRSCQPHPLAPDIVHMRKDRHNRAALAGWFGLPGGGGKMLDKNLVHPIISRKNLDSRPAGISSHLLLPAQHCGRIHPRRLQCRHRHRQHA